MYRVARMPWAARARKSAGAKAENGDRRDLEKEEPKLELRDPNLPTGTWYQWSRAQHSPAARARAPTRSCLLYTSDAADE